MAKMYYEKDCDLNKLTGKTVAIVGCGSCATACQTGGEPQIKELAAILEQAGKKVVATTIADYCCMNLGVKAKMKAAEAFRETLSQAMPDLDSEELNKLTVQFTSNLSRKI